jgi:transcriptional regulator with GAF, ATPase, and Fis domain
VVELKAQLEERDRELADAREHLAEARQHLAEALDQQDATSEILGIISDLPGNLETVFRAILKNAIRVCDARFGTIFSYNNEHLHPAASIGTPPALAAFQQRRGPFRPQPGTLHDRALQTKQVVDSADGAAEPIPGVSSALGGARSTVVVPLLKDDQLVGTIVICRQEVRPFSEKQSEEFRHAGRDRHREHAPAQRVARLAATADRGSRGAWRHQQVDG